VQGCIPSFSNTWFSLCTGSREFACDKQLWTADRELNMGLTTSHCNKLGHHAILNVTWELLSRGVVNTAMNLRIQ
jgi:hypothetical protein